MDEKYCPECNQTLPLENFPAGSTRKDGTRTPYYLCLLCRQKKRREEYDEKREEQKERSRQHSKRYHAIADDFVNEYLSTHPCVDCGESDRVVLEFDHVKGFKVNCVSTMRRNHNSPSVQKLQKEIEKCEVRCANCHRRVTHQRRQEQRSII